MVDPLANPEALIRRVYAYAAYRLGSGPDAEDVTSETFARALRYRESYDARRGDPTAWLIGIARRCIAGLGADDVVAPSAAVEESLEDPAELVAGRLDLAGAVARLSPRERELIALRYGADLTARQIGALLEMRTNAVEVALHRALGRIRDGLGETKPAAADFAPKSPTPAESA